MYVKSVHLTIFFWQDLRKSLLFILVRVCEEHTCGVCRLCPVREEEVMLVKLILTCATSVFSTSPPSLPEGFEEARSSELPTSVALPGVKAPRSGAEFIDASVTLVL